jgi:ABC-type dipeptide/oligopeptide/nickel transport system ATPase component
MKKIDLHIHTKASPYSDSVYDFTLSKLQEYIEKLSIDCIAITNHNLFDLEQFNQISEQIESTVLPGIEIDIEKGHLLLISENTELDDFKTKCLQVEHLIQSKSDYISVAQLKEIFVDLSKYLLIPHYDKVPILKPEIIEQLKPFIASGEVSSAKKFKYCINDINSLVPVLFSDLRFTHQMTEFSPRQTFIDIDDTSLRAIKTCLMDKNKVFLHHSEGHRFFQIFEDGQKLSTGLNVILGERSSGKTYTLKTIARLYNNVKHIKQFELLETDEEKDKKKFDELLTTKQSSVSEQFLKEFKEVVEDVVKIDRKENEKRIESYLNSLLKVAAEEEKMDVYSKCTLFNESKFIETNNETLKQLVEATELLIENIQYRTLIDKYISKKILQELVVELMMKYEEVQQKNLKARWINSLVTNIQKELQSATASEHVKDIDFYNFLLEKEKLKKFENIASQIKREKVIEQKEVRRFKIVASTKRFTGAQELKNKSGIQQTAFSNAFPQYDSPIQFLEELKKMERIPETEFYKYFVDVSYKILNEHGAEVSGGERSEFNLLDKIQHAHHYDFLLIDEPESSFDNLFLKNEVNEQIRQISKTVPVIVVTHNNTVGASIKPDYILYTKKEIVNGKAIYKIFSGNPADTILKTIDGEEINNYNIMLNCLEAGDSAYVERKQSYENLKN